MDINNILRALKGKTDKYLAAAIIIILLVFVGLWYYILYSSAPKPGVEENMAEKLRRAKRQRIVSQLQGLEKQKEENPPLPREEIIKQLKELNK